ncbi:MAG: LysR family transcriptional regulator [Acidobacteria bacterium]|nr:LysR family transcriptional regulator [Acidobacteriota bacterium]
MNLDYLITFRNVARLGSFSEVALKMGLSQPAVSFQIRKLEQKFGIRLLDRTQKAIKLTVAGKRLLQFIESIEGDLGRLENDFEKMRQDISGDLWIIASTIPSEYILPGLLAEFKEMHPTVRVKVDTLDSLDAVKGVLEGKYEVGFCGIKPGEQGLESFRVCGDEIVLIVFPDHPFAQRNWISYSELEAEHLIFRSETSGTQQSLEKLAAQSKIKFKKLTPHLIMGSTQAVVSAVEAGAGVAFISKSAIKKSLELGLVRQVAIKGFSLKRDFYCFYPRERIVSRLIKEFIAFIRKETSSGGL